MIVCCIPQLNTAGFASSVWGDNPLLTSALRIRVFFIEGTKSTIDCKQFDSSCIHKVFRLDGFSKTNPRAWAFFIKTTTSWGHRRILMLHRFHIKGHVRMFADDVILMASTNALKASVMVSLLLLWGGFKVTDRWDTFWDINFKAYPLLLFSNRSIWNRLTAGGRF